MEESIFIGNVGFGTNYPTPINGTIRYSTSSSNPFTNTYFDFWSLFPVKGSLFLTKAVACLFCNEIFMCFLSAFCLRSCHIYRAPSWNSSSSRTHSIKTAMPFRGKTGVWPKLAAGWLAVFKLLSRTHNTDAASSSCSSLRPVGCPIYMVKSHWMFCRDQKSTKIRGKKGLHPTEVK